MTRLEALEAVAAAARVLVAPLNRDNCCSHCGWTGAHLQHCPVVALRDALAALDQTAPQSPDVDPQPRLGESGQP